MQTNRREGEWYELLRACPAVPIAQDGSDLEPAEMPPAMQVRIIEQRGDHVIVESRASTETQRWRYRLARADLDRAVTPPETLPREGQAPTAPATSAGSPD